MKTQLVSLEGKDCSVTDLLVEAIIRKQNHETLYPSLIKFPEFNFQVINQALASNSIALAQIVGNNDVTEAIVENLDQVVGNIDVEEAAAVSNQAIVSNTKGVVAVFTADKLEKSGNGTYICSESFQTIRLNGITQPLCRDEKFFNQPRGARCTGVLVGEDLVATTKHSLNLRRIDEYLFIFDFTMKSLEIREENIYHGKEVFREGGTSDWVLVRLARKAPQTRVRTVRTFRELPDEQNVYILGFPCGLPMKFGGSALIKNLPGSEGFVASFDAYQGNSGSPVFAFNDEVVGLVASDPVEDFKFDPARSCCKSNEVALEKWSGDKCIKASEFASHL